MRLVASERDRVRAAVRLSGRSGADPTIVAVEAIIAARLARVAAAIEAAANTLDDLALAMVVGGEDNPEGTAITAGIVQKCAAIVRQHKPTESEETQ